MHPRFLMALVFVLTAIGHCRGTLRSAKDSRRVSVAPTVLTQIEKLFTTVLNPSKVGLASHRTYVVSS